MSLTESASSGDRLAALCDLRDLLASNLVSCDSLRDFSSLSARMQSVLAEIDELKPPEKKGDSIDEVAARRASRGSSTGKGSSRTADDAR